MDLKKFTQKDFNLIIEGAKIYDSKLRNKDFLIVFKEIDILGNDKIKYIEVKCRKNNYMHLTGVKYINKNLRNKNKNENYDIVYANNFFDLIMSSRLNINYCYYKADETTNIKLEILNHILNFPFNAVMIGNYNYSKPHLYTKKICGTITSCIGFINANESLYPNTILKEDIRNITEKTFPIIMICSKSKDETKYNVITRKGKLFNKVAIPKEIKELLIDNLL